MIAENAATQVPVEGRVFVVEVGDRQVGPAVAIEVAAGDAHARLVGAVGVAGNAGRLADFLEAEAAPVEEEELGRLVVGDEEVDPSVAVQVGRNHAEAPAVRYRRCRPRR